MKRKNLMDVMQVTERIETYGIDSFTDKDLLKMALEDNSTLFSDSLAQDIGDVFNSCSSFTEAFTKLTKVDNLSKEKAIAISAMVEYARRRVHKEKHSLRTPSDVFEEIKHYANDEQEVFLVIGVNGANEIVFTKAVSIGILDRALIHPRETFADAIKNRCSSILVAHNHPSSNLTPSEADIMSTLRLVKAGEILGIKVLDHLIFSRDGYHSMRENAEM